MILIISAQEDIHATTVQNALHQRGHDATILDLRDFPTKSALSLAYGHDNDRRLLSHSGGSIDLDAVNVVWWRRPQAYVPAADIAEPEMHNFVFHECEEAIQGLWLTLDATWINPPGNDERAARKAWQLDVARACGLTVPRTLISNDPDAALRFIGQEGVERTIYKAFQGSEAAWRETRLLRPEEMDMIETVAHAPLIFQEYIDAVVDLRVTVVGDQIFAAAVHSQESAYSIDFRMDMANTTMTPHELPADICTGLQKLMTRLGLVYGAVDLRLRPDGSYVFLEINPAGQWLFVEEATGQDITGALATRMIDADQPAVSLPDLALVSG